MLRIVLCLILLLCATFLGYWFSLRLLRRSDNLFTLIECIDKMKNFISFGRYEIARVVSLSFENVEDFKAFTENDDDEEFFEWWRSCVATLNFSTALNKEDRELLLRFGENLGVTDVEGQISNCELYITLFKKCFDNAKEIENKNVRLYRILGFSLGSLIALIVL